MKNRDEKRNFSFKLNKLFKLFAFSNKREEKRELSPLEKIEDEILKQENNLLLQNEYDKIKIVIKKIADLKLQKMGLTSKSSYIKQACKLLKDKSEEHLMQALYYLDTIPLNKLDSNEQKEVLECSAYIAEILQEYKRASDYYKRAINSCNDVGIVQEFKKYIERYNKLNSANKEIKEDKHLRDLEVTYVNMSDEKMLKTAKTLENIALYYARSPKSRELSKRYYKETLYILKKLYKQNRGKYSCEYIKTLIDGVEFFMFSNIYLKEAIDLLKDSSNCKEDRDILVDRVKSLKDKAFIKKSKIYKDIIEL